MILPSWTLLVRPSASTVSSVAVKELEINYLESQWPIIMGNFQWTTGYFRVEWPMIFGCLAAQVLQYGTTINS